MESRVATEVDQLVRKALRLEELKLRQQWRKADIEEEQRAALQRIHLLVTSLGDLARAAVSLADGLGAYDADDDENGKRFMPQGPF